MLIYIMGKYQDEMMMSRTVYYLYGEELGLIFLAAEKAKCPKYNLLASCSFRNYIGLFYQPFMKN